MIDVAPHPASALPAPTGADRFALRVIQVGAILVALAAATFKLYELDRFFVPKELVLHATALLAGLALVRTFRRATFTKADRLLIAFLLLSALSALFATNVWLAGRALAISASGVVLFWCGRALRDAGLARPLLSAVALGVVVAAITALLQTYGLRTDFFSINRAPGGTLGNRNFVAHMAAFGLPVVLLAALGARSLRGYLLGALGCTLVVASLVLTRSRAGWLALGCVLVVLVGAMIVARALRTSGRTWLRLLGVIALTGAGVFGAIYTPNTLRWRSDNPYLESIRGVANYREGSGAGRLVQYRQSLRMTLSNPLLGVGPGNWAVEYPDFAARRDPSLDRSTPGTTSNPWPSSDWISFIAERGPIAAVILGLAFLAIILSGVRQLRGAESVEEGLGAMALLGTLMAAGVAGAFDAVLLLALPTLFVWVTLGALWQPEPLTGTAAVVAPRRNRTGALALALAALVAGAGMVRSAAQLVSIGMATKAESRSALTLAARIDPANYRLRLRLARMTRGDTRCEHALAARSLYPNASAARSLARRCD